MRKGYFTPPVLIILAVIIFAVAILIAINTDLVKRIKKEPSPTPSSSSTNWPTEFQTPKPIPALQYKDEIVDWKTLYSIDYPRNYTFLENEYLSVDGVKVPTKNQIAIISGIIPELNNGFALYITHKILVDKSLSLEKIVAYETEGCISKYFKSKPYVIGGKEALIFEDIGCAPFMNTEIYTLNKGIFYTIHIDSTAKFTEYKNYTDQILSTFRFE